MTFIPSVQQEALFDWAVNGKGNAFVEAVAGAGKTTSLLEVCGRISGEIIIVAYSKKIAEEIKGKLAKRDIKAFCSTFHSFGFRAWMFKNKGCKFDGLKMYKIMDELKTPESYHQFCMKLVSLAKQAVIEIEDTHRWLEIVNHHDLTYDLDDNQSAEFGIKLAQAMLVKSNEIANQSIDYDDMIYCPVFFGIKVLQHDWVLVDEAQDTNPARRILASMMTRPKTGRMIWVGDRKQAIFGFTGADSDSVDLIIKTFKCKSLPLTVTYRCPRSVVAEALKYVSHIQADESSKNGIVRHMERNEFPNVYENLKKEDAILCRKTAPLVEVAYTLLRKGIACHVEGKDIGKGLINIMKRWKTNNLDVFLEKLEIWEKRQVARMIEKKNEVGAASFQDRCETIRVLAEGCGDVKCMIDKVSNMFGDSDSDDPKERARTNNLTLSTVHKSKGREWGTVYILGYGEYMPSPMAKQAWEKEQETNICYVAVTRAMDELVLVG